MKTAKLPLAYFPLESYQSRYTGLMSCEGGWMEKVLGSKFALESVRPEQETVIIRSGEVLDAVQRPIYAMRQVIEYLTTTPSSMPVYVDDMFHPGIESLAYAKRKNPPLLYTYCWAQTFDRYDFTRDLPWMRAWEIMAAQHYSKIFIASPILEDLILTTFPDLEGRVHNVGLPFDSKDVLRVREQSKVVYPDYHVVYSSRMDKEKNFGFFCDVVEQLGGKYKFAVSTGHDEMRGTDTAGILHAKDLVERGKLTVYTNMTKPDYYALLSKSVVQFNCLGGDTLVLTDKGAFPIKELAGKYHSLLTPSGKWQRCPVKSYGKQKLLKLSFGRGSNSVFTVKATSKHRWKLANGRFVTSDQLREGDILAQIVPDVPVYFESSGDLHEYLNGIRHGIIFGDGTERKQGGYAVRLCGKKKELLPYFRGFKHSFPPSCNGDPVVYISGKRSWASLKQLPTGWTTGYLLGFFRGWLATDGSISSSCHNYSLSGTPENIEWARRHSTLVGWHPAGIAHGSLSGGFSGVRTPTDRLTFYSDTLRADDLLNKLESDKPYRPRAYVFKGATPVGEEEVFCAEVEGDQAFALWNGMVTGNCAQQDWVSFTLLEALTCGCIPIYPMFRDFVNVFADSSEFLYAPLNLSQACSRIDQALTAAPYAAWAKQFAAETLRYYDGSIGRLADIMQDHISANLYAK